MPPFFSTSTAISKEDALLGSIFKLNDQLLMELFHERRFVKLYNGSFQLKLGDES